MKVILLKEVKTLGKEDQVVEVSDGHARNFLFPQNLAVAATTEALKRKKERDEAKDKKADKELSAYGDLAQRLDGHELVIEQKMNNEGTLYAAVNEQTIIAMLKKAGFTIDKSMIQLDEPFKEPGEKLIKIQLPHGFEAEVRVVVEGK